jgi:phosphatidate cytidylyltransferase
MDNLLKRILSSIILLPFIFYLLFKGSYILILFIFILFFVACYEWHSITNDIFLKLFGYFFLILSFYSFYQISLYKAFVFFVIITCVATDIGGYIFGKILKGPKLTKISPKKTYNGVIGGYFLSLVSFMIIVNFNDNFTASIKYFLLIFIISTVSQIGDIIISYFKRLSNIKDTGKIIPGHGGLLDRIDGMIFVFPIIYFINFFENLTI